MRAFGHHLRRTHVRKGVNFPNTTQAIGSKTDSLSAIPTRLPDYLANSGDWQHLYNVFDDWNATDPLPPHISYRRSPQCSADYSSHRSKSDIPQTKSYEIGCCGPRCLMRFWDVNVYYFPTPKSNDSCLQYVSYNLTHVTSGTFPDTRTAANTGNIDLPFFSEPPVSTVTPRALRPRNGESIVVDDKGFTL